VPYGDGGDAFVAGVGKKFRSEGAKLLVVDADGSHCQAGPITLVSFPGGTSVFPGSFTNLLDGMTQIVSRYKWLNVPAEKIQHFKCSECVSMGIHPRCDEISCQII